MTNEILTLLISERAKITAAIEALQGPSKRGPGRPPKSTATSDTEAITAPVKVRKVRQFSDEQKAAAAERMRVMWANKKLGKKGVKKASKKVAE